MEGYSKPGAIYFSIGEITSYAKINSSEISEDAPIVTGTYVGAPPYEKIQGKLSKLAMEFHGAEHQVFNCFQQKIKHLKANASLRLLSKFIPSTEEVEKAEPFSFYCGTTIFLSSAILLLLAALPNLFQFYNTNLFFMILWMSFSILISLLVAIKVQKKYFLCKPQTYQIKIALIALKEVLTNANHYEFTSSIRILSEDSLTYTSYQQPDLGL